MTATTERPSELHPVKSIELEVRKPKRLPKLLIAALVISALAVLAFVVPITPGLMMAAFAFRGSVATLAVLLAAILLMRPEDN